VYAECEDLLTALCCFAVCVFRSANPIDPRSYRGWNGTAWATAWVNPYTDDQHDLNAGDHTCAVVPTAGTSAHPNPRQFSGDWMPPGWPSHVMLGWPEGSKNRVAYAFPDWAVGSAAPFTSWSQPQCACLQSVLHELILWCCYASTRVRAQALLLKCSVWYWPLTCRSGYHRVGPTSH
jgi:hypothetical protein